MAEMMSDDGRRNGRPVRSNRTGAGSAPRARTDRRPRGATLRATQPASPRLASRRKVRVPELLGGLFLVAGCALAAIVWHTTTTKQTPVLVLAGPVTRGQVITASDLTSAQVNADGIALVPVSRAEDFVGQIAAVDLATGAPVTDDVISAFVPLADGQAMVGRKLDPGQFPGGLSVGDDVSVVMVADPALVTAPADADLGDNPAGTGIVPRTTTEAAIVESVELLDDGTQAVVVTLRMSRSGAESVAATTDVRLVQVG